jgi:hypothetical protein
VLQDRDLPLLDFFFGYAASVIIDMLGIMLRDFDRSLLLLDRDRPPLDLSLDGVFLDLSSARATETCSDICVRPRYPDLFST